MQAVLLLVSLLVLCTVSAAAYASKVSSNGGVFVAYKNRLLQEEASIARGKSLKLGATNPGDVSAVKALYNSTNGPNWKHNDSWLDGDPCAKRWKGVTCDSVEGETRIVGVFLGGNDLQGTLPSEMAELTKLRLLGLSYNKLNGTLPIGFFQMQSLASMDFSGCFRLSGSLPNEISMKSLNILALGSNNFSGDLPTKWQTPNLQNLYLYDNKFTGNLPEGISELKHLKELDISINKLNGSLPDSYGKLSELTKLWLYRNKLDYGSIPEGWSGLERLSDIHLDNLEGSFPLIFQHWPAIISIDFSSGQLQGAIPDSLCRSVNLKILFIYNNTLNGSIPQCMCNMTSLEILDASNNQLSGSIPMCIGGMSAISHLSLSRNKLSGSIPTSIGGLGNLHIFDISYNQLSGKLPTDLNRVTSMQKFIVDNNMFNTTIIGVKKFFQQLSVTVYLYGGSCKMSHNSWVCPLPSYVFGSCNATCV